MASEILFDRKWKIVLTTDTKEKTLKDLKVTFNITNTLLGDPSLGTFQIFNINAETIAMLTDATCMIFFYAGYGTDDENSWSVLFQGEVTNSYPVQQGTERVWNVWARTAFTLLNQTRPSADSIKSEITVKDILEKLVEDSLVLANKPVYINGCDKELLTADTEDDYSITGTFGEEFDNILLHLGFGWQVQGDALVVYNQTNTDPSSLDGEAIKVSNKTGLLTVPVVDYTGITFTSLLNGRFKPTAVIDVAPNTARYNLGNEFYVKRVDRGEWKAEGKFRIYEVTHRGDTRGDKWDTDVTAFYRRN